VDFGLRVEDVGRFTVLAVSGEVDVFTAPQLRQRLLELIEDEKRHIVVDLRPTEFLDSTGLGALASGVKRMRTLDGDIGLVCPPGHIRTILELVAFNQVFGIYDDLESALDRAAASGTDAAPAE
jgi:anti-sigma B factor antagonist